MQLGHNFAVIIPARMGSTRLPNKPLLDIGGVPMVIRVANICIDAVGREKVFVSTPDDSIIEACNSFNVNSVRSSIECSTGTDRVLEFSLNNDYEFYINVQGDEPLLDSQIIVDFIKKALVLDSTTIGVMKIEDENEIISPTVVKVAISGNKLIYASRSPIPFNRDGGHQTYFKHTGLYAFKKAGLREFEQGIGELEEVEKVEILRLLENRVIVRTVEVPKYGSAVDTPEDLERVRSQF